MNVCKSILLLLIVSSHVNSQNIVTVGTDQNCDYASVGAVPNNANIVIRLTNQQIQNHIEITNRGIEIHGGYNNCSDAEDNIVSNTKTMVSGNTFFSAIAIKTTASGSNPLITVKLSGLELFDGRVNNGTLAGGLSIIGNVRAYVSNAIIRDNLNTAVSLSGLLNAQLTLEQVEILNHSNLAQAGGIELTSGASVTLINSYVHDNTGLYGGGINVASESTLTLIDTEISQNTATNSGGGISCTNNSTLNIFQGSKISNNNALFGGGINASDHCSVLIESGDMLEPDSSTYGVINNLATNRGGGIHIDQSGLTLKGGHDYFANVINNEVTANNPGEGGGIYATGEDSQITIVNGRINQNHASRGGAFYLRNRSELTMMRASGVCFDDQLCSEITDNESVFLGNIVAADCATAHVFQTTITENSAGTTAVMHLEGNGIDSCLSSFEGNLVFENHGMGDNSNNLFSLDNQASLDFAFNTVSDNDTDGIFLLLNNNNTHQTLNINSSIISNSDATVISASSPNHIYSGQCFLVPAPNLLPIEFGPIIIANDPGFSNPNNDDYQLTIFSTPLDYCDDSVYVAQRHDIKGIPRGIGLIAPILGPFDMGAFEFNNNELSDVIFYDRFD